MIELLFSLGDAMARIRRGNGWEALTLFQPSYETTEGQIVMSDEFQIGSEANLSLLTSKLIEAGFGPEAPGGAS